MSIQGPSAAPSRFPELRPGRPGPPAQAADPAPSAAKAREASLWETLTDDERAFFDQQAALGPLTYGKQRAASAPAAPTGQRLDVRA